MVVYYTQLKSIAFLKRQVYKVRWSVLMYPDVPWLPFLVSFYLSFPLIPVSQSTLGGPCHRRTSGHTPTFYHLIRNDCVFSFQNLVTLVHLLVGLEVSIQDGGYPAKQVETNKPLRLLILTKYCAAYIHSHPEYGWRFTLLKHESKFGNRVGIGSIN